MRSPSLVLLLLLAACDQRSTEQRTRAAVASAEQAATQDDKSIPCARIGGTGLRRECLVERTDSPEGLILTLRHPDGAFHRILVTRDGRGVVAADGAEPAKVAILSGNRIAVAIGGDRYELPATIKSASGQ